MFKRLKCILKSRRHYCPSNDCSSFVLPQIFAHRSSVDQTMEHMKFIHSHLANNIDDIKQLIEIGHSSESLNLLEVTNVKIDNMNTMSNDLVWKLFNRSH